jgi:hypothetical protein
MAVTDVGICNLALSKIGHETRISAIGEAGRAGEQCEIFYEYTRDFMLAAHLWNFAIGRAALSLDAISPAFEYDNQYLLPADNLRAVELYQERQPFKVEGSRLLTDASVANLVYIKKVTDTQLFSPLFSKALVTQLAFDLSNVIAGSNKVNMKEVKDSLREAKRRDGQEGTPDRVISTGPADFKNGFWE